MATDHVLTPLLSSHSVAADTAAMAEQLAEAEGLTLIPSSNMTGYKGVSIHGKKYVARGKVHGADFTLGLYGTAAEAALAYARHLGPELCVEQLQKPLSSRGAPVHRDPLSFGVPYRAHAADLSKRQRYADEVTTVESIVAAQVDGDEDDDDAETPVSVKTVTTEPAHAESSVVSGSSPTIKRKRTARTDEYEFTMSPSTRELTVPVPERAVRATCTITFHFA